MSTLIITLIILAIATIFFFARRNSANPKLNLPLGAVRALGSFERWYCSWHNFGNIYGFCMTANLEGPHISDQQAIEIFKRVLRKHPSIGFCIKDDDYNTFQPHWVKIESIEDKFRVKRVNRIDDNTWKQVIYTEKSTPFNMDSDDLLFRITFVESPECASWDLVLTVHHVLFDGRSASELLKSFLDGYRDLIDNLPVAEERIDLTDEEKLPKILEDVVDLRPTAIQIIKALQDLFFPQFTPKSDAWVYPKDSKQIPIEQRECLTEWISIPQDLVSQLRTKARENSSTINSAILTSISYALFEILGDEAPSIDLGVAIDLRRFGNPPLSPDTIGVYVCASDVNVRNNPNKIFWKDAKHIRDVCQENIAPGIKKVGLIPYAGKHLKTLIEKRNSKSVNARNISFTISNLGPMPFENNYGKLALKDVWFTQMKRGEGATFSLTVVSAKNGNLNIAISYLDEEATKKIGQRLAERTRDVLRSSLAQ